MIRARFGFDCGFVYVYVFTVLLVVCACLALLVNFVSCFLFCTVFQINASIQAGVVLYRSSDRTGEKASRE